MHEGLVKISDRGCVVTWDFDVMRHDVVFTVYRLKDPPPASRGPKSPLLTADGGGTGSSSTANGGKAVAAAAAGGKEGGEGGGDAPKEDAAAGGGTAFTFPAKSELAAEGVVGEKKPETADEAAAASGAMAMESSSHVSCIEKHWREGVDYFKVESSIVCHDGESIQGSHVTSHVGTYVLQWRFYDKPPPTGHHHSALDDVIDSITSTQHKAKVMYYYEVLSSSDYRGSMTSLQSCQSAFSTISKASKHSTSGVSSGGVSSSLSHHGAGPGRSAGAGVGLASPPMDKVHKKQTSA